MQVCCRGANNSLQTRKRFKQGIIQQTNLHYYYCLIGSQTVDLLLLDLRTNSPVNSNFQDQMNGQNNDVSVWQFAYGMCKNNIQDYKSIQKQIWNSLIKPVNKHAQTNTSNPKRKHQNRKKLNLWKMFLHFFLLDKAFVSARQQARPRFISLPVTRNFKSTL